MKICRRHVTINAVGRGGRGDHVGLPPPVKKVLETQNTKHKTYTLTYY